MLSGGEWSQAFAFRYAEGDYVIRFGMHPEDYVSDQMASKFASDVLPIPEVIEIGKVFGFFYAISKRAFGTMLNSLNSIQMQDIIPSLCETLDSIRKANISSTSGFGRWNQGGNALFASWQEFLLDVINDSSSLKIYGWKSALKNSSVGENLFNEAYDILKNTVDNLQPVRSLIHNDLLHNNVLVHKNRITAVIDWGNALYGDFLYDIAHFIFWASYYQSMQDIDWQSEALKHNKSVGLQMPQFLQRLKCCQIHIGLDAQAYCAYTKQWEQLEMVAKKTLDIANL